MNKHWILYFGAAKLVAIEQDLVHHDLCFVSRYPLALLLK